MTKQWPAIADGRAGLVMFARGDRVFPVDDLGGGVWSRRGTVLSVHPLSWEEMQPSSGGVRVDATPAATSGCARATVLWDDGSAEVLAEDKLCLVYDQEAPVGIRVVTMPMSQPCDVVDHGGQVVLVLREGLLPPEAVIALRAGLGRVRAALTPGHTDTASAAEQRRRDLGLLNALIAEMTSTGVAPTGRAAAGTRSAGPMPAGPMPAVTPTGTAPPPAPATTGTSGEPARNPDAGRPAAAVGRPTTAPGGQSGNAPRPSAGVPRSGVSVGRPDAVPPGFRPRIPGPGEPARPAAVGSAPAGDEVVVGGYLPAEPAQPSGMTRRTQGGQGPEGGQRPAAAVLRPDVMVGGPGDGAATGPQVRPDLGGRPDVFVGRPDTDADIEGMVASPQGRAVTNPGTGPLPGSGPQARSRR
ncbi:hypothetical protein [Parafrankia sp. FMc2]|uniref:hypothetical protein n=1 Tax=Parafrankia sp. FMc2 TaxID=3233196 RepID=UPI0034D4B587